MKPLALKIVGAVILALLMELSFLLLDGMGIMSEISFWLFRFLSGGL